MNTHPATALPGFLLSFLCCLTAPALAEVVVTAAAPSGSVVAGGSASVDLFFLNTGSAPASVDVPAQLPCRLLLGGGREQAAIMHRSDLPAEAAAAPGAASVAPGAFKHATYALPLPGGISGTVVVVVPDVAGAPRTALSVAAPPGALAAPAPADFTAASGNNTNEPLPPTAERGESGIAQYVPGRFTGHEPMYFLVGPDAPNAKFQISFKYQIFNPDGPLVHSVPAFGGVHVAYSQTSFWDLEGESKPFFDNSYRPELLWSADDLRLKMTPSVVSRLGMQAGLQHESNGKEGADSRSLNIAYIRPSFTFGDAKGDGLFLTFAPKAFAYIGDIGDNPDIKDYRGHFELRGIVGWQEGLQLSTIGRVGDDWDKGSVQFDLSYPLRKVFAGNIDLFLHAQYFNGFGESLLEYNESTSAFRLGVSLVR